MKHLFSILAFTFAAQVATAQPAMNENRNGNMTAAYKSGEWLQYIVSYRAKMWPNTDMGIVTMEVVDDRVDSVPAYKITAYATVKGMFRWFYKLDDYYHSWLAKDDLKPIKSSAEISEGSYRFSSSFSYDWRNMTVSTRYRNHKRPNDSTKRMKLPEDGMDGVSLFYHLRCMDIASYKAGEINKLHLVMDDTVRVLKYKFHGREIRNVSGLGRVGTLKFSCQLAASEAESFEEGSEFFVWISDDPNKIPVYMDLPLKVGSARVRLSGYKNLKYPGDSALRK